MKMQRTLYNNPEVEVSKEDESACLADLLLIIDSIRDNQVINKNHGWFLKEVMRRRVQGESVRAIAMSYKIPQTTFRKQVRGFEEYILEQYKLINDEETN